MPVTPQITITGKLKDLFGAVDNKATLLFLLCGYGSSVPRISGTAIIANTAPLKKAVDANGAFSIALWGNDVILPTNTYYTIQVIDDAGNIIQTNAYQFTGSGTFDLSAVVPYNLNPFVPPVPPAPQPGTLFVSVAYSATPVFDALNTAGIITFKMPLTGNVTLPTLVNITPGQLITFAFKQDPTGGRTLVWPSNVKNGMVIDGAPNAMSIETFVVLDDGNAYPISIGTVN